MRRKMTPQSLSLNQWTDAIQRLSVHEVELGLDRVSQVWNRLHGGRLPARVVTVAGTNGKGTCAHFLERVLRAGGYRTGLYTSPHLLRFNERVRVDGRPVSDETLCAAFERVEHARGDVPLTFFEYTTLAALVCFVAVDLDVIVLEVGLGGRLDAVNVIDADVAVVTRIGLDHTEYLGTTLNSIAREKAGVFRPNRPAIVASGSAPSALRDAARHVAARLVERDVAFTVTATKDDTGEHFDWCYGGLSFAALPAPSGAAIDSIAGGLAALMVLGCRPDEQTVRDVLASWCLPGRVQLVSGAPSWVLDVAHNPQAAAHLASWLREQAKPVRAILGMLEDKDTGGFVAELADVVNRWHAVSIDGPRGLRADALAARLRDAGMTTVSTSASVPGALALARSQASADDVVLVCGSFQVVGPALAWLGLYSDAIS